MPAGNLCRKGRTRRKLNHHMLKYQTKKQAMTALSML
ncbi:hypothetical protein Ahy_B09g095660 isoform C [Arachis hypogaea]|uniref:Uncharacterized protein n=1 Tax=Arachis hypogaea TaxID=3818 RepID=A0A444XGN5_ARAHY|nr:hypothetical protein Ahy_B09g095660 isoform C [Arachis hypogaea]